MNSINENEAAKDDLAERLRAAWSKYQQFFGVPPHGTYKQLRAMLEFMPQPTQPQPRRAIADIPK